MANAKAGLQFADVLLLDTVELTFTFFQYLIRKRRKLTGRAMNENWQLMGDKSNKAMDIITSLRFNTNSPLSRANRVILPNLLTYNYHGASLDGLTREMITVISLIMF